MDLLDNNSKSIVVKANDLVEATYKLTLGEQKIILLLASMIKREDKEFQKYRIKIHEFMKLMGVKNKSTYDQVEKSTKELMKKIFTIKKANSRLQLGWLSSVEYFYGEGAVELSFHPDLKPYLLQLKDNFTSYRLENVIQLKSNYSVRVYELLKRFEFRKEKEFIIEVDALKEMLGIEPEEYPLYANFKQKIIKVAQKELEAKTDTYFAVEEIKTNKKVQKLRFIIISKQKPKEETTNKNIEEIVNKFKELTAGAELHPERVKELISLKGFDEVNKYLKNFQKFIRPGIKDLAALFYTAVEQEYKIPKSSSKSKSNIPQHDNFTPRNYDDEFYENLYENT